MKALAPLAAVAASLRCFCHCQKSKWILEFKVTMKAWPSKLLMDFGVLSYHESIGDSDCCHQNSKDYKKVVKFLPSLQAFIAFVAVTSLNGFRSFMLT